ncbi:MAG TPA: type III pantothenate kinase [Acidobacteriaceae bacterium]|nr:type III pantothenate kinase [Acidobacteriaceae bacterium]
MLLAIDVGNTNTVLGLYPLATPGDTTLIAHWRITTPRNLTLDELGVLLANLFALRSIDHASVTAIAISSVVPPLDTILRRACELHFNLKPLFVEPGIRTGLPIRTDNPAEVGADRIVNCIAAIDYFKQAASTPPHSTPPEQYLSSRSPLGLSSRGEAEGPASPPAQAQPTNPPIIVVDFGTATTFDCISSKGEFLGGAIAPGLGISAEALFARAARLPRIDIRKPAKVIGTGTVDNLQIGLYYGYIGLVDGILARMIAELGPQTRTLATGGLAPLIAPGSQYLTQVDEHLTLNGLRLLYHLNQHTTPTAPTKPRTHPR